MIFIPQNGPEAISRYRGEIRENTPNTYLQYSYTTFDSDVITPFDYNMSIIFNYTLIKGYSVNFANKFITKKYGEQLSDDEIEAIVKALSKTHTAFIEQKIQEVKK